MSRSDERFWSMVRWNLCHVPRYIIAVRPRTALTNDDAKALAPTLEWTRRHESLSMYELMLALEVRLWTTGRKPCDGGLLTAATTVPPCGALHCVALLLQYPQS